MKRSMKIAGTLAAALMMSAPLVLAPTASFAATTQHGDHYANNRGGKQVAGGKYDAKYDAKGNRGSQQVAMYGKFRDGKAGEHHRYTDRAHRPTPRFEKIVFEKHPGFVFFAGHWTWQTNHWHWNAGTWQHR